MDRHPAISARVLVASCSVMTGYITELQRLLVTGNHRSAIATLNAVLVEAIRYEQQLQELCLEVKSQFEKRSEAPANKAGRILWSSGDRRENDGKD